MAESTPRQTLAENLRLLRLIRGWSQEAVAAAADLDRTYVSSLERAERNVGIDSLAKLAKAFEISVADLLVEPDVSGLGQHLLKRIRRSFSDDAIREPDFFYVLPIVLPNFALN
jgi:transcriptional regulator with XRE-family HTH domain